MNILTHGKKLRGQNIGSAKIRISASSSKVFLIEFKGKNYTILFLQVTSL